MSVFVVNALFNYIIALKSFRASRDGLQCQGSLTQSNVNWKRVCQKVPSLCHVITRKALQHH